MQFIDEDDFEEVEKTREITVKGHKWEIERRDPYGFWFFLQGKKKSMPDALSGAYTSPDNCQKALVEYINRQ